MCLSSVAMSFLNAQTDSTGTQETDTIDERKNFLLAVPAAFYTPETKWGFGAVGIYNYYIDPKDRISPSSQVQLALTYTQKKQILAFIPFRQYWNEWKNIAEGEVGYYDYIYPFFGIGSKTNESAFEQYSSKYFRFRLDALRKISPHFYAGLRYWLDTPDIYKRKDEGLLDQLDILGETGGTISGIGPQLRYDKRDNIYSSRKGAYVNFIYQTFSKTIGSKFNFGRVRLDARKYLNWKRIVIATQLYSDINWGEVPFFQKARLGGTKQLRGYLDGRFIDDISLLPQIETRFPVWRKFGGVGFFGIGTVAENLKSLNSSEWNYSYGAGLRYTLDEEKHLKVRLDYAFTPEGTNFYFTIGEAF